jgi:hypothetical protein
LNISKCSIHKNDLVTSSQDKGHSRIIKGTTTSRLAGNRMGEAIESSFDGLIIRGTDKESVIAGISAI